MSETTDDVRDARRARHRAIRAEVAQEESDAAEADAVEKAAARDDVMGGPGPRQQAD